MMQVYTIEQYLITYQHPILEVQLGREAAYCKAIKTMKADPKYVVFNAYFIKLVNELQTAFTGAYFFDSQKGVLWLECLEDATLVRMRQ
jgi:hypothetical protein